MRKLSPFLSILFLLTTIQLSLAADKWYSQLLSSVQTYHSDFLLKSNEIKSITFETEEKLLVGFWTNPIKITNGQIKKYVGNFPISVEHKEEKRAIKSLFGSSALFTPVEGKILLDITNNAEEDFQIVIYTQDLNFSF